MCVTCAERRPSLLPNDPRGVLTTGQRETPGSGPACLPLRRSNSGSPAGTPTDPRAGRICGMGLSLCVHVCMVSWHMPV